MQNNKMTNEERIARMSELRAIAEKLCLSYNEAMNGDAIADDEHGDGPKSIADIERDIAKAIDGHTAIARDMVFDECAADPEGPMMAAIKRLSFTTIATKDEKRGEKGNQFTVRVIVEKEKPIDLLRLHEYVDGGIGVDKNWVYMVEKLNFLLTAQKCNDLGVDPARVNDSYLMSEISRDINMGKTPTSKTNILKTLQMVVSAMIGGNYKAVSHDVNYLMSIYSKKGRSALTVACANHSRMRGYMAEICHRIVTGKTYDVEFKAKKK